MMGRMRDFVGEEVMRDCKVILRSYIPLKELEKMDGLDMIFMVPGVFKNNLDGDWRVKGDIVGYLNMSNFKVASKITSYSNSRLTRDIYRRYGMDEMGLMEVNLLQMGDYYGDGERDIDFLMVVSDVGRDIKNVNLFYELRKHLKGKFCLVSGERVERRVKGVDYVEGLGEGEVERYYRRSKVLINCSFFDSMSNTVLEGIKNGCYVLVSENNGIVDYIGKENIVSGYDVRDWVKVCGGVMGRWGRLDRRGNFERLREKSWEVEIRLLELLSKE